MPTCHLCAAYEHPECGIYNRIPPEGFAVKCRHYIEDESKHGPEPEQEQHRPECQGCGCNVDGWCLRIDHPDWRWNFIKIREGMRCRNLGE